MTLISVFTMMLSSCSNFNSIGGCPDAEIEWIDMVMINDIKYEHHFPEPADENIPIDFEIGRELGKVDYKMADSACSNHKMKNGDAAYLEKGTPIYEIKGYPTALVVAANDKVFVADTNLRAKTAGDLYPMNKLVKNIYIESTEDGSRIHTFSQPSKNKFLDAWYKLKLEDIQTLNKEGKMEGKRIFLEFELENGVLFRQLYWADSNTFHNGAIGNKEIKDVINHELSMLKK
ncbi:hypothetical protein JOC95_003002 [Bacillus tianshenii]|uniref:Lipoprotein n=3 Tax=Sutcliffiella tianshenii TaxID=1463404 RepID=A0ABS2P2L6_9BACI|nr:hypothetical protein [Bacillus tianshenii]